MSPAEIDALTPLTVMRLVMTARWRAGDHAGALVAAEAAALYCHPWGCCRFRLEGAPIGTGIGTNEAHFAL